MPRAALGTLAGDRTRICGSGGHRSIRYTTSVYDAKYAYRIIIANILKKHKEKFTFRKKSCILYQYGRKRAPQMKHGRNIMTLGLCMIVKNEEEVLER